VSALPCSASSLRAADAWRASRLSVLRNDETITVQCSSSTAHKRASSLTVDHTACAAAAFTIVTTVQRGTASDTLQASTGAPSI
jgi:hypothetical protein